jgi:hypothetical protein
MIEQEKTDKNNKNEKAFMHFLGQNIGLFTSKSLFRNLGLALESDSDESLNREYKRLVGHEHDFSALVPALATERASATARTDLKTDSD